MQKNDWYAPLPKHWHGINKTEHLEKGIMVFPSIYMEGAAALGKTTAVKMLLAAHPETVPFVLDMEKERNDLESFREKLELIQSREKTQAVWIIFENINGTIPSDIMEQIADFCMELPDAWRAILVSRERPDEKLLPLLWKRKMELLSWDSLLLTKEEVRRLAEYGGSTLNPSDIYEESGGWAGCADMMIRLSASAGSDKKEPKTAKELRQCYEIDTYLQREIVDTLSPEEWEMMRWGQRCPWFSESLCGNVWKDRRIVECLKLLERKGMFVRDRQRNRWRIAPLFQRAVSANREREEDTALPDETETWKRLGDWYREHGFIREALQCLKQSGDETAWYTCLAEHYDEVLFLEIPWEEVMEWKENTPEICYLRGMYCYFHQNLEGLNREIRNVEQMGEEEPKKHEVLLNLNFVKPDLSLDDWIVMLSNNTARRGKARLYSILGYSHTFLCGLRDLSELFACTKWEENRKCRIWRDGLGENEWKCYQMARLDYYLETERREKMEEEDQKLLGQEKLHLEGAVFSDETEEEIWQFRLVRLYLLCKMQEKNPQAETIKQIRKLEDSLLKENSAVCVRNTEAVVSLYSFRWGEQERLTRWLRTAAAENGTKIGEETYVMRCCQAKGYVLLNQPERAQKVLRQVIPYAQWYRRSRFLAELLFEQGVAAWQEDRHIQALRSVIESFLVTGDRHYVGFYAGYGKTGAEALNAYMEWLRSSEPEKWRRKKKYHYGNVVRMPAGDYMEVVLRCAEKNSRNTIKSQKEEVREKLTLMEISVLVHQPGNEQCPDL